MPRGQYDREAAKARKLAKQNGQEPKPLLYVMIEFDDADMLMAGKEEILQASKAYGHVAACEAHNMPKVMSFK